MCSDANTLATCKSDGTGFTTETCALGCGSMPAPHCQVVVPSLPASVDDFQSGLADLVIPNTAPHFINTDDGSITNLRAAGTGNKSQIVFRTTAPGANNKGAGIFSVNRLEVQNGATLQVVGSRALVIVANTTIAVAGVIDARAYDLVDNKICNTPGAPGPGGFAGSTTASATAPARAAAAAARALAAMAAAGAGATGASAETGGPAARREATRASAASSTSRRRLRRSAAAPAAGPGPARSRSAVAVGAPSTWSRRPAW